MSVDTVQRRLLRVKTEGMYSSFSPTKKKQTMCCDVVDLTNVAATTMMMTMITTR